MIKINPNEAYTVRELIEALEQCPQDYIVTIVCDGRVTTFDSLGIDTEFETVDLYEVE